MSTPHQIIDSIRAAPRIPAPSQAVFKILQLTKDTDCNVHELAKLIAKDAGLTAQLLREVNSALYGCATSTSSVATACMRLGFKRVRSAVINQHVVNGLSKARPPGFDSNRYWQAALATSVAAQELARQVAPASSEEAGTAGLLCDFGVGLLAFGVPEQYAQVLARLKHPPAPPLHVVERSVLGISHDEVGAEILKDWKLDARILEAVRHHHVDPLGPKYAGLDGFVKIVGGAVALCGIALEGSDMDRIAELFTRLEGLTKDADALVTKLMDNLIERIKEAAGNYAVELGSLDQMQANFDELAGAIPDVAVAMTFRPMDRHHFET